MSFFNKFYSFLCMTAYKQSKKIIKHKRALTENHSESCIIRTGKTIWYPSYKKYYYCDKPSGEGWFFRLKPIKSDGKYPVFFYMHGSGHTIAAPFFKKSDWTDWMFEQRRKQQS